MRVCGIIWLILIVMGCHSQNENGLVRDIPLHPQQVEEEEVGEQPDYSKSIDTNWQVSFYQGDPDSTFSSIFIRDKGLYITDSIGNAANFDYKTDKWNIEDENRVINIVLSCFIADQKARCKSECNWIDKLQILTDSIHKNKTK